MPPSIIGVYLLSCLSDDANTATKNYLKHAANHRRSNFIVIGSPYGVKACSINCSIGQHVQPIGDQCRGFSDDTQHDFEYEHKAVNRKKRDQNPLLLAVFRLYFADVRL